MPLPVTFAKRLVMVTGKGNVMYTSYPEVPSGGNILYAWGGYSLQSYKGVLGAMETWYRYSNLIGKCIERSHSAGILRPVLLYAPTYLCIFKLR